MKTRFWSHDLVDVMTRRVLAVVEELPSQELWVHVSRGLSRSHQNVSLDDFIDYCRAHPALDVNGGRVRWSPTAADAPGMDHHLAKLEEIIVRVMARAGAGGPDRTMTLEEIEGHCVGHTIDRRQISAESLARTVWHSAVIVPLADGTFGVVKEGLRGVAPADLASVMKEHRLDHVIRKALAISGPTTLAELHQTLVRARPSLRFGEAPTMGELQKFLVSRATFSVDGDMVTAAVPLDVQRLLTPAEHALAMCFIAEAATSMSLDKLKNRASDAGIEPVTLRYLLRTSPLIVTNAQSHQVSIRGGGAGLGMARTRAEWTL